MQKVWAADITPGMTIKTDFADVFLMRVDVAERVSIRGVDVETGKDVIGTFDRDHELLWIDQVRGEPGVPFEVAVQAIYHVAEQFGQDREMATLRYSDKVGPWASGGATVAIAEAIATLSRPDGSDEEGE